MRTQKHLSILLTLALVLGLLPWTMLPARAEAGDAPATQWFSDSERAYAEDEVLVLFREGCSAAELTEAVNASGCTLPQAVTDEDVSLGFAKLRLSGGCDVRQAIARLSTLPEIRSAQPNYIYRLPDDIPSGERAESENGIARTCSAEINDPEADQQWMLDAVNACEAWDVVKTEGRVTVAVLDNGFSLDHEDLVNNYLRDESGNIVQYDAFHQDNEVGRADHGTHCAGIIAAEANNGIGIAGVSYNAKILPVQALDVVSGGAHTYDLARAHRWTVQYGIDHPEANLRVISMSFALDIGVQQREDFRTGSLDEIFLDSIQNGCEHNILSVIAASNAADTFDGAYLTYPVDFADNALCVIAVAQADDGSFERADYSNYNMQGQRTKDIAAPGSDIYSTVWNQKTRFSEGERHNTYEYCSGTSMATPCAAGVAALVFAANPDLTAREAAEIICGSARQINSDTVSYDETGFSLEYGYGMIDAAAAVRAATRCLRGAAAITAGGDAALTPIVDRVPQDPGAWTWTTSDASVATVTNGTVRGIAGGHALISATRGDVTLTKLVTVYDASFSGASTAEARAVNGVIRFRTEPFQDAWLLDVSAPPGVYQASADTTEVFPTVSNGSGTEHWLVGPSAGTVTLTATLSSDPGIKVDWEVEVTPADISKTDILVENQIWTGGAVNAEPVVTYQGVIPEKLQDVYKPDKITLEKGVDYTLSYENNVDAGSATVTVTGIGDFQGAVSKSFLIVQDLTISESDVSFNGLDGSYTYNGKEHEIGGVTVTHNGTGLVEGTDYKVVYADNVDAGEATVTVQGIGSYAGAVSRHFTIVPADIEGATVGDIPNQPFVGEPSQLLGTVVKFGDMELVPSVMDSDGNDLLGDYKLSFANNTAPGTAQAIFTGIGNYTGTKIVPFKICGEDDIILPEDITVLEPEGGFVYNGEEHKPAVTVKNRNGQTLTEGVDYKLAEYRDNTDAGTAWVSVVPIGEYAANSMPGNTVMTTFEIRKADITPVVHISGWYAGGVPSVPTVTGNPGGGEVTYRYKASGAADDAYSAAVPTAPGSYTVKARIADTKNYNGGTATADFNIFAPDSGGGGSGGGSAATSNPDGSKTVTTANPDGSTVTVTTAKDGSTTTTEKTADGSVTTVKTDKSGNVVRTEINPSAKAIENAAKSGEPVTLPVTVRAAGEAESASEVKITLPEGEKSVTVEIPVAGVTPGTVAVLVKADGTEEIVKTSTTSKDGVVLTLDAGATVKIVDNTKTMNDVTGDEWYAGSVAWATSREVMNGMGDGTFAPNAGTTQGMMEQILYNIDGNALVSAAEGEKWWSAADRWANERSITRGIGDAYDPSAPATRETDVLMLCNYARSKGCDVSARADLSKFADFGDVSDGARDAMAWAVEVGVINGTVDENGRVILDAQGIATRAQISAITERFCKKVLK